MREAAKKPTEEQVTEQDTTRHIMQRGYVERGAEGERQRTEILERGKRERATDASREVESAGFALEATATPADSQVIGEGSELDGGKTGWYGGLILGGGSLTGKEVSGFGLVGLKGGGSLYQGRLRIEIHGLIGSSNLHAESDLVASIKNEFSLGWGLAIQYLITPPKTFMGLYVHGGFRDSYLFWDYANPVHVPGGAADEMAEQDILKYSELYAGLGVSVARFAYGQVGINVSGGFRFYSDATDEGFANDIFGDEAFAQLMLDVVFGRFR